MNLTFRERDQQLCPDSGKRCYVSEIKAHVCAKRLAVKNRRNGDRKPVHAYRCPSCGHFHVGHTEMARRRA